MTIHEHPLAWRWTDARYALLPESTLTQIQPVELSEAARLFQKRLNSLGRDSLLPEFFATITKYPAHVPVDVGCAWLRTQQPDLFMKVFVSWEQSVAVRTTWQIFSAYWDDFCYPSSDDVLVWPESESWTLLYHHEEEFQFGVRRKA